MWRTLMIIITVCAITWTKCLAQNIDGESIKRDKRHSIIAIIKHHRGRILRRPQYPGINVLKPPPVKHIHNGPYFINHNFNCDGVGHTIQPLKLQEIIKSEEIHLHLPRSQFHVQLESNKSPFAYPSSAGTISIGNNFGGNSHNWEPHQGQFSIEDHGLDQNVDVQSHNLDLSGPVFGNEENFGITTENVDLNTHSFETHKYNSNALPSVLKYEFENADDDSKELGGETLKGTTVSINKGYINLQGHLESFGSTQSLSKVQIPQIYNHPLEHDPRKASYDTPGAVDSYGDLVQSKSKLPPKATHPNNPVPEEFTKIEDYFSADLGSVSHFYGNDRSANVRLGRQLKDEDEFTEKTEINKNENLVGNMKNITELVISMRTHRNFNGTSTRIASSELGLNETSDKYLNHRYENELQG